MSREDKYGEDGLRRYMDAESIEQAPEGFSSKVMSHIYMEKKPVSTEKSSMVPVVFGALFLALAVAALFVPEGSMPLPDFKFPENFNFSFPELTSGITIPQIVFYIIAGVVFLAVFDSGLHHIFRKEQK
ncbi:MAG: hypothetical protein ACM3UT_11440 [Chloroflexota bacterium]